MKQFKKPYRTHVTNKKAISVALGLIFSTINFAQAQPRVGIAPCFEKLEDLVGKTSATSISSLIRETENPKWKKALKAFRDLEGSLKSGSDLTGNAVIMSSVRGFIRNLKTLPPKTSVQNLLRHIESIVINKQLSIMAYIKITQDYEEVLGFHPTATAIEDIYENFGVIELPVWTQTPISKYFNIEDLNYLWAAGILPVSFIKGGGMYDFKKHDEAHAQGALSALRTLKLIEKKDPKELIDEGRRFFQKFVSTADRLPTERLKIALHTLNYRKSHEIGGGPLIDGRERAEVLIAYSESPISVDVTRKIKKLTIPDLRKYIKLILPQLPNLNKTVQFESPDLTAGLSGKEWSAVINALLDLDER